MFYDIWNSLIDKSKTKFLTKVDRFKLTNTTSEIFDLPSGPMIIEMLMYIVFIDPRDTATHVYQRLSYFDTYSASTDYNIDNFNL